MTQHSNQVTTTATPSLEGLSSLLAEQSSHTTTRRIPPLEQWSPKFCANMDLTIKANGEWWHEGRKMTRQSMIDLFSSVLWAEKADNGVAYFLKTPVEKIGISVEDVPLLITQVDTLKKNGKTYLEFCTPHGDSVIADEQHPIVLQQPTNATPHSSPQPYILVRQNGDSKLYGLIHRNVFYHLINMGELHENGAETCLRLKSGDCVFNLTVPTE